MALTLLAIASRKALFHENTEIFQTVSARIEAHASVTAPRVHAQDHAGKAWDAQFNGQRRTATLGPKRCLSSLEVLRIDSMAQTLPRSGLQHRQNLRHPDFSQRVDPCTPAAYGRLGGQQQGRLDATRACDAHSHLGSRHLLAVLAAQVFVLGHLMIRYAFAGHCGCIL